VSDVPGGDERAALTTTLDRHRAVVVRKARGLTDDQARGTALPSGTSIWGLLSHLTYVERWWFSTVVAEAEPAFPFTWDEWDADPDVDWRGAHFGSLAEVVAEYEAECARSNAVLAAADLDTVVTPRDGREPRSVRWVALHMVEEIARHAGHADIVRELIDGATGD